MRREAGIAPSTSAAEGLWMGVATNDPGAVSGVHHHGEAESGIFILRGRIRFRWGLKLENSIDTGPGDFIYVPPFEVHMEENLSAEEPAQFVLARNSNGVIVINVPDPRQPA